MTAAGPGEDLRRALAEAADHELELAAALMRATAGTGVGGRTGAETLFDAFADCCQAELGRRGELLDGLAAELAAGDD